MCFDLCVHPRGHVLVSARAGASVHTCTHARANRPPWSASQGNNLFTALERLEDYLLARETCSSCVRTRACVSASSCVQAGRPVTGAHSASSAQATHQKRRRRPLSCPGPAQACSQQRGESVRMPLGAQGTAHGCAATARAGAHAHLLVRELAERRPVRAFGRPREGAKASAAPTTTAAATRLLMLRAWRERVGLGLLDVVSFVVISFFKKRNFLEALR
jgi:hypothetical protein